MMACNIAQSWSRHKSSNPLRKKSSTPSLSNFAPCSRITARFTVFRFDLSVPDGMSTKDSNILISELFTRLRGEFTAKAWGNQPIKKFAYGWCREKEKAKQVHYHCWIALPYFQVRTAGFGNEGTIGRISRIWSDLTDGVSRVHLPQGRYIIRQGDHDSLVAMVKRVSYLAKNRGKGGDKKGQPKIFSSSRLQMKVRETEKS